MNILDKIIASKRRDIKLIKDKIADIDIMGAHGLSLEVDLLTNSHYKLSNDQISEKPKADICHNIKDYTSYDGPSDLSKIREKQSFSSFIGSKDQFVVIGEIKRGSPSKGLFAENLSVNSTLDTYKEHGINCISVLTNNEYFYGSYRDLYQVRNSYDGYILNKEFIIDELQIDIAKKMGADIILLIASALDIKRLIELYDYASSKGLTSIVEVHNQDELEKCLSFKPRIIGINNRNLKTFNTDIKNSLDMISSIDKKHLANISFISESGIKTREEIDQLKRAGFKGVLIGESFIRNIGDLDSILKNKSI